MFLLLAVKLSESICMFIPDTELVYHETRERAYKALGKEGQKVTVLPPEHGYSLAITEAPGYIQIHAGDAQSADPQTGKYHKTCCGIETEAAAKALLGALKSSFPQIFEDNDECGS